MTTTYASITTEPVVGPGLIRRYGLAELSDGRPSVLSLWSQAADYEVVEDWPGPAATETPLAASVLHFDGPIGPAGRTAHDRAWTGRIRPALAGVPECVGAIALWNPQTRSIVVVNFATSLDGLTAVGTAVRATVLLPGEDPALLPGPDRVDVSTVVDTNEAVTVKATEKENGS